MSKNTTRYKKETNALTFNATANHSLCKKFIYCVPVSIRKTITYYTETINSPSDVVRSAIVGTIHKELGDCE